RSLLNVTLHEGRNRIVRRMMEAVGHPVDRLSRIGIGPVRLGQLPVGQTRDITPEELGALMDLVGL
ncbi:MAG: MFS transporter, partial [Arachnia sp.]